MGIYYDIFYDRSNPTKAYKIPYAGDYFQSQFKYGKTELKHVSENEYTYVTDYGVDGIPKGVESTEFFKQFGAETYDQKVIFLSGLDGGYVNGVGDTPYLLINREHYPITDWGQNVYRSSFRFVALGGAFVFEIYVMWDGIGAADLGLHVVPNFTYGDFKERRITYVMMPASIQDMLKHYTDSTATHADDGYIYQSAYVAVTSQFYTGSTYNIANGGGYISDSGGVQLHTNAYTQSDVDNFVNNVKNDTADVDNDDDTHDTDGGSDGDGDGTVPSGDDIDLPTIPSKNVIGTGLLHGYVVSDSELHSFSEWLWQDDIIKYLSSLFSQNPLECIINTNLLPFTPTSSGSENIIVGGKISTASGSKLSTQYMSFDFNYDGLKSHLWGSALDYERGLKCTLYVPFVGQVNIATNLCAYTHLTLRYIIDVVSGQGIVALLSKKSTATWDLERDDIVVDTWSFNCASTIPLVRRDISGLISGAIGATASIASGNVLGVASSVMQAKPSVQKSGQYNTNSGYMGNRRPYITYEFTKAVIPSNLYTTSGRPQYASVKLSTCKGFTMCKNPQIEFKNCKPTADEIEKIYNMLEEGVII